MLSWLWGYLIPVGIVLVFWGAKPAEQGRRITPLVALALALAVVGYWLTGFAFHLGGAGVIAPDAALQGLDRIWSPFDQTRGLGWGMIGLAGFALSGAEVTPRALELFLSYLPLLSAAVLLVALALSSQPRWIMVGAASLMAFWVWPLAACWIWGGGWLAQLGTTQALGHGVVDFGGSALVFWLPGAFATGVLLSAPRRPVSGAAGLPPAYAPMAAVLGAMVGALGWMGWALGAPFHTSGAAIEWSRTALSLLVSMAGATLGAQIYGWLVSGAPEPLLTGRGMLAGIGASLAGAPCFAPTVALGLGLGIGLLVPLMLYLVEERWRLADEAGLITLALSASLIGVLAVGLFADGSAGRGWNGVTAGAIRGLLIGGGAAQIGAQLAGLVVLGAWGLMWGAGLGGALRLSQRTSDAAPSLPHATEQPTLEGEPEWPQSPLSPEPESPTPKAEVA